MAEDFTTQVTNPDGSMTEIATELVNPDGTPNYQAILALLSQGGLGAGLQGAPQVQALMQYIAKLASQQGQGPQPQNQQPQGQPAQAPSQKQPQQEQQPQGRLLQHGRFGVATPAGWGGQPPASGSDSRTLSSSGAQDASNWQTAQGSQMTLPGQPTITNAAPATGQPGSAGGGAQPGDTGTTPRATWTLPGQGAGGGQDMLSAYGAGGEQQPMYAGGAGGGQAPMYAGAGGAGGGYTGGAGGGDAGGAGGGQLPTMQSAYGNQQPTMQSAYGAGGGQLPTLAWRTPQGAGGGQLPMYGAGGGQLPDYGAGGGQLPMYGPQPKPWEDAGA